MRCQFDMVLCGRALQEKDQRNLGKNDVNICGFGLHPQEEMLLVWG